MNTTTNKRENYEERVLTELRILDANLKSKNQSNTVKINGWNGRQQLEVNGQPVGHFVTRPEMVSQLYAMNKLFERAFGL